jgi:hypothetical protein
MNDEWKKYYEFLNSEECKKIIRLSKNKNQSNNFFQEINEMTEAKKKRKERKDKLKRVFNYDDEMGFLKSFLKLKSKDISSKKITLDEFLETAKKMFVETQQVSDVIFDYFEEELRIIEKIKILTLEQNTVKEKLKHIQKEIKQLQNVLKDDDDDDEYDLDFDLDDEYDDEKGYIYYKNTKNNKLP